MTGTPPATAATMDELDVVLLGQAGERGSAVGDELLVGGDDGFLPEVRARRIQPSIGVETADEFDDDVHVGAEDLVDRFGPDDIPGDGFGGVGGALAFDVAVVDVGELDGLGTSTAARTRATEEPTVPKPRMATRTGPEGLRVCGLPGEALREMDGVFAGWLRFAAGHSGFSMDFQYWTRAANWRQALKVAIASGPRRREVEMVRSAWERLSSS